MIDNKSFIDEKEQCVYDCKLTACETNTIKSLGNSNRDKEIVDHLILHCKFASALWSEVLIMFGVQWVMSGTIVSLLFAWRNWLGTYSSKVWNMIPACLMWLV